MCNEKPIMKVSKILKIRRYLLCWPQISPLSFDFWEQRKISPQVSGI